MTENEIGSIIVDIAVRLHKKLGSGLLESVYEVIMMKKLAEKGLSVQRQVSIPIEFEGEHFDEGFRVDLFVEGKVIIELKSVEKLTESHKKQLLTYLRLTDTKLGFILNFGSGACQIFCVNDKIYQNGTRSFPNSMANWFSACPQSLIGIVHFSDALRIAKYNILSIASSVQNVERFFVTFRN